MTVILCPTRGGQSSAPNQQWAIDLAKETDAQLIFLYISNVNFLDRLAAPVLVDISQELEEMGEFILAMAQQLARKSGVQADAIVREGRFLQNILDTVDENAVDIVVIGQAAEGEGVLSEELRTRLAESLREKGVELYVLRDGEIVAHFEPNRDAPDTENGS